MSNTYLVIAELNDRGKKYRALQQTLSDYEEVLTIIPNSVWGIKTAKTKIDTLYKALRESIDGEDQFLLLQLNKTKWTGKLEFDHRGWLEEDITEEIRDFLAHLVS